MADIGPGRPWLRRELLRWGIGGAVVFAAHVATGYGMVAFAPGKETPAIEKAMTVELTPMVISSPAPVATETAEQDQPDQIAELQDQPPALTEEQTDEPEVTETTETPPETVEPIQEEELVEKVEPEPEVKAEVALPAPRKKPEPRKVERKKLTEPVKKREKPEKKVAAKSKTQNTKPPADSRQARAGTTTPAASAASISRWRAQAHAAIARRKPRSARGSGTARLQFILSASGAVVSSGVVRSSGDPKLDQAALTAVRSARIPAPPPQLVGSPITLPFSFR